MLNRRMVLVTHTSEIQTQKWTLCLFVCVCVWPQKWVHAGGDFKLNLPRPWWRLRPALPSAVFEPSPVIYEKGEWRNPVFVCSSSSSSSHLFSFLFTPSLSPAIPPSFVKSAVAAGGEFAQNVLPGVSISCRGERRRRRRRREGKGNE